jgi:hypothetical protein
LNQLINLVRIFSSTSIELELIELKVKSLVQFIQFKRTEEKIQTRLISVLNGKKSLNSVGVGVLWSPPCRQHAENRIQKTEYRKQNTENRIEEENSCS